VTVPVLVPLLDGAADLASGVVRRGGLVQALSAVERALLAVLVAQPRTTVDRYALAEAIGRGADDARAVDFAMRRLRTKIEADPAHPRHLISVYGAGYRFEPLDREAPAPEPAPAPAPIALPGGRRADLGRREVAGPDGGAAELTDREADVLSELIRAGGRAVSREDLLARVWKLRRASALRYVDQVVHRLRRKLDDDDAAVLRTVPGLGYLLERASAPSRGNAEPPGDRTFGHAALRDSVQALLAGSRAVALVGPPGAGKSRLAVEVALAGSEPAWRVDLTRLPAPTPSAVGGALAETLRLPTADRAPLDEIAWALRELGAVVVVLDGADAAAPVLGEVVAALRARAPEARVLVTSRIAPDRFPGPSVEVPPLDPDPARALFVARSRDARAAWDPADHEAAIAALVERLDRLPLAIELAAARAGVLTPDQMLEQLDRRFAILAHATRGSLREALEWSWNLLPERARQVLERLAVFEGAFDLEAAGEIAGDDLLEPLDTLHRASWLRVGVVQGRAGYRLYESLRAFALERLRERGDDAEAFRRHAAWATAGARPLLLDQGLRHRVALQLRPRRDELLAAAERAPDPVLRAWAWAGAVTVQMFLGPSVTAPALVEGDLPADVVALIAIARANLAREVPARSAAVERLAALLPGLGDAPRLSGIVRYAIGQALWEMGDHRSRPHLEAAVSDLVRARADDLAAMAASTLAIPLRHGGDQDGADALLSDALARARASGDVFAEAYVRNGLGVNHTFAGRSEEAARELRHALEMYRAIDFLPGRRAILNNLGNVELHAGNFDAAAAWYGEAFEEARISGNRAVQARVACLIAFTEIGKGDLAAAERIARESLALHREVGHGRDQGYPLGCLGMVAQAEGRGAEAATLYERARATFAEAGDRVTAAQFHALEAAARAEAGDLEGARRALAEATSGLPAPVPSATAVLRCAEAVLCALSGDAEAARRLASDPELARHHTFMSRWVAARASALAPG
jgi:DNA-binding response OmpR family regulator/predicted ATPase